MSSKVIMFRVDENLYKAIKMFAEQHNFDNISELLREVIVMHFMGYLLGYFGNWDYNKVREEFLEKYKNSEKVKK